MANIFESIYGRFLTRSKLLEYANLVYDKDGKLKKLEDISDIDGAIKYNQDRANEIKRHLRKDANYSDKREMFDYQKNVEKLKKHKKKMKENKLYGPLRNFIIKEIKNLIREKETKFQTGTINTLNRLKESKMKKHEIRQLVREQIKLFLKEQGIIEAQKIKFKKGHKQPEYDSEGAAINALNIWNKVDNIVAVKRKLSNGKWVIDLYKQ